METKGEVNTAKMELIISCTKTDSRGER